MITSLPSWLASVQWHSCREVVSSFLDVLVWELFVGRAGSTSAALWTGQSSSEPTLRCSFSGWKHSSTGFQLWPRSWTPRRRRSSWRSARWEARPRLIRWRLWWTQGSNGRGSSHLQCFRYQWNEWQLRREALAVAAEGEKRSEGVQVITIIHPQCHT